MRKSLLLKQEGYVRKHWLYGLRYPKSLFIISTVLICMFFADTALAQGVKVTGTVSDTTNTALIGVAVRVRGTQTGAATDVNGKFSLTAPDANAVLVFSYIGFTTQEVPLNGQTNLSIRLKGNRSSLQEVVVTGFTSQRRESITGSIASTTSKDIERVHAGSTVSTALAGKIAGVTFRQSEGRPGAAANIQIRNMGSPLYVIDGVQQNVNAFNNLATNDIASVTVLKDASAAIYGVQAANGVVVVTT